MGREHRERLANDTKLYVGKNTVVPYCPTGWLQFKKKMQLCISKEPGDGMLNISTMKER